MIRKILVFLMLAQMSGFADPLSEALQKMRGGKSHGIMLYHGKASDRLHQDVLKDYPWNSKFDFVMISAHDETTHPWTNKKCKAIDVFNNIGNIPAGTMTYIDKDGMFVRDLTFTNLFIQYKRERIELIDDYISSELFQDYGFSQFLMAKSPETKKFFDRVGQSKVLINQYDGLEFDRFLTDFSGRQFAMTEIESKFILVCSGDHPLFERILKEIRFYFPKVSIVVEGGKSAIPFEKEYDIEETFQISDYEEGMPMIYYMNNQGQIFEGNGYTPMLAFASVCGLPLGREFYTENLDIPLAEYFTKK